jgi:hypothetical protein
MLLSWLKNRPKVSQNTIKSIGGEDSMKDNALLAGFLALVVLIALAPAAHADYCLTNQDTPTYVLVGKGFVVPAKGACKAFNGFTPSLGQNSPTIGTGCKSSDGSHLNFTLTTSFPENNGFIEIDSITLTLPSQSGTSSATFISGGVPGAGSFPVVGSACKSIAIPAVSSTP